MTATRFFVYGSLCTGMVHFSKIQAFIESSEPAQIRATAYRLKVGFPVLLQQGHDQVPGFFVELKSSDLLVGLLDEFYGFNALNTDKSLYLREQVTVYFDDGRTAQAATYFLNPKKLPVTAKVIPGGDWKKSLDEAPPVTATLTERQKAYVARLGTSTGREIIPIDLKLYRELMNLELIVDKGRRLALSKLGHEVYRHLA